MIALWNQAAQLSGEPSVTKDTVIIVGTQTGEKTYEYGLIAESSRAIVIEAYDYDDSFDTDPELAGDRTQNALNKSDALVGSLRRVLNPNSPQRKNIEEICRKNGFEFDPNKCFGLSDDSTSTVSTGVWPYLFDRLKGLASVDLLAKLEGKNQRKPGPAAEVGPVVASLGGWLRFYNLILHAYQEAIAARKNQQSLPTDGIIKMQTTLVLRPLIELSKRITFENEVSMRLLEAKSGEFYEKNQHPSGLINPWDYVTEVGNTNPISDDIENYIRHRSVRSGVFNKMRRAVLDKLPRGEGPAVKAAALAARTPLTQPAELPEEIPTVTMTPELERVNKLSAEIYDVISMEEELAATGAEGFVFGPFDHTKFDQRVHHYGRAGNAFVAGQLDSRDMRKPRLFIDNGCWTGFLNLASTLANKGKAKDFVPVWKTFSTKDIRHIVTSYWDCLRYNPNQYNPHNNRLPSLFLRFAAKAQQRDVEQLTKRIQQERGRKYHQFHQGQPQTAIESSGTPPNGKRYTIFHCVSATSDNHTLNEEDAEFGRHIAKRQGGVVYGGMGEHAGSALAKSYKDAGGPHLTAISTKPIVAREANDKKLPKYADYRELVRNIYERMARMIAFSDDISISPGGWGTYLQELPSFLKLMVVAGHLVAGKNVIIHSPSLHQGKLFPGSNFAKNAVNLFFNTDVRDVNLSLRGFPNIYLTYTNEERFEVYDRLATQHAAKHGLKLGAAQTPAPTGPLKTATA